MPGIKQRIADDVKQAMRDKERERLAALRLITAAIKQREVDERVELDDSGTLAVLDKLAKQHRDSIDQYSQGGRQDLADKEEYELGVVREYLPRPLDDNELEDLIGQAIGEAGAASVQDMGKVMGLLKARVQGRADMGEVSRRVKARLG